VAAGMRSHSGAPPPPPYSVRRCVLGLGREIYLAVFGLYLDRTGPEWGTGEKYVPVPSQCC